MSLTNLQVADRLEIHIVKTIWPKGEVMVREALYISAIIRRFPVPDGPARDLSKTFLRNEALQELIKLVRNVFYALDGAPEVVAEYLKLRGLVFKGDRVLTCKGVIRL